MGESGDSVEMDWDLSSYFPEFGGDEMVQFREALENDIQGLHEAAADLGTLAAENQGAWEEVFLRYEDLVSRAWHLGSYYGCLTAADAENEDYLAAEAELARTGAELQKVQVALQQGLKVVSDEDFATFLERPGLADARHYLVRERRDAQFKMASEQEALAADLGVDGIEGWGRLYNTVSAKLAFDMVYPDGSKESVPMSQRRSLMESPDRRVREAAFTGGNAAWEAVQDTAAAALNAISGTRLTLNKHRGVPHFLEVALFQAGITQASLDAMLEAIESERVLGRRILRLKAQAMGVDAVAWCDLAAPLPLSGQAEIPWDRGSQVVREAFSQAYPALGDYVQSVYDQKWVDWSPRSGKRPGAFCTSSPVSQQARVYMTYNQTVGDVLTLAHEAGHAFHAHVLRDARAYAQMYPATLAEAASTFGEMVLIDGILADPATDDAQKARTLDLAVAHGAIYLLDIPVRYAFEKALYTERSAGELGVSRLKELMVDTQREVFGEVLAEGGEDPYFWASKLHFYITGLTFYNFPYTFGFLLSRGLYALRKSEGPEFLPRYEAFLQLTGSDTVEAVAERSIGQDLKSPAFWVEAVRSLEPQLVELESLLPGMLLADAAEPKGED